MSLITSLGLKMLLPAVDAVIYKRDLDHNQIPVHQGNLKRVFVYDKYLEDIVSLTEIGTMNVFPCREVETTVEGESIFWML